MPTTNRSCVFGKIYIGGKLLHDTEIGRDPFNPMSSSSVVEIFQQQTDLSIGQLKLEQIEKGAKALAADIQVMIDSGVRLFIADAVSEKHLDTLAEQIDRFSLLPSGAGGFAKAYAEVSTGADLLCPDEGLHNQKGPVVITSYSIHYTKLYEAFNRVSVDGKLICCSADIAVFLLEDSEHLFADHVIEGAAAVRFAGGHQ